MRIFRQQKLWNDSMRTSDIKRPYAKQEMCEKILKKNIYMLFVVYIFRLWSTII